MYTQKRIVVEDIKDFKKVSLDIKYIQSLKLSTVDFTGIRRICDFDIIDQLDYLLLTTKTYPEGFCLKKTPSFNDTDFLSIQINPNDHLSATPDVIMELKGRGLRIELNESKDFILNLILNNYHNCKLDESMYSDQHELAPMDITFTCKPYTSSQVEEKAKELLTKREDLFKEEYDLINGEKLALWIKSREGDLHHYIDDYISRESGRPNRVHYYRNGNIKREEWIDTHEDGLLKYIVRDNNLPNRIEYYENGNPQSKRWIIDSADEVDPFTHYLNYEQSKLNHPNYEEYYENGKIKAEYWIEGEFQFIDRPDDLPSEILYHENGRVKCSEWISGMSYKNLPEDRPNHIEYDENGKIKCEKWLDDFDDEGYIYYRLRPNDQPNCIEFDDNGRYENWMDIDGSYMDKGLGKPNRVYIPNQGNKEEFIVDKDGDVSKIIDFKPNLEK